MKTKFDALILFGSSSDAYVYEPLCSLLRENGLEVDFEIISAHRNPDRLEERLSEKNYACVIAGAGISAHLPGVVASKVQVPVYGIPVEAQFGGLDAVMSIQMMPRGVPVLMCGPKKWDLFVPFLQAVKNLEGTWARSIEICVQPEVLETVAFKKEFTRLSNMADKRGLSLVIVDSPSKTQPAIQFVSQESDISDNPFALHVPLLTSEDRASIEAAIRCFEWTTKGGLWVGVNNSINALHFIAKALASEDRLPPVYHIGSVKNILGHKDSNELIFSYSDRYSVFDWGEMPDKIPYKGQCLAAMAYMFFDALSKPDSWQDWSIEGEEGENLSEILSDLRQNGLRHHMNKGLVNEYLQDVSLGEPTPHLSVERVSVLRPSYAHGHYDYSIYRGRPTNALVPLEIIFRFGVPQGSSLMKRIDDADYLEELGLSEKPDFGDMFDKPVIEFSTKLESTDVYMPQDRAQEIAGLNDIEMKRLHELVRVLAYRLKDLFNSANLTLWDGKFEFAFTEADQAGNRSFQLVDSIGPDELRLTYDGVQLSKECLRRPYRGSSWHYAISEAKALAQERGSRNWKQICKNELHQTPEPLSEEFLSLISSMYTSLSNAISMYLYDKPVFPDSPNIDDVAKRLAATSQGENK